MSHSESIRNIHYTRYKLGEASRTDLIELIKWFEKTLQVKEDTIKSFEELITNHICRPER